MQMSTLHVLLSEVVSASFAVSQQSVVPIVGCIEMLDHPPAAPEVVCTDWSSLVNWFSRGTHCSEEDLSSTPAS